MSRMLFSGVMALGLACTLVAEEAAEGRPERPQRGPRGNCTELRQAAEANREARRAHRREQMEEGQAFHQSLEGLETDAKIDKMIARRTEQHNENQQFQATCHQRMIAAVNGCEGMPDQARQHLLEKINQRHTDATGFHQQVFEETIAFLNGLKNSDKDEQELKQALKDYGKQVRAKMEAWHQEHRPGRGRARGPRGERGTERTKA